MIAATGDNQIRADRIPLLMAMGISVAAITHPTTGAGAVFIQDIPACVVAVGVPAKVEMNRPV
ncbi:serine O-acetyltransferase [Dorea sp. D27]|nr:serine O-acetyltransferase [Dorea sp. D27]